MAIGVSYDVIFMDCQMREMTGYEAATEIRRLEQPNRRVTIIAMAADASAACREPVKPEQKKVVLRKVVPAALLT
jgi:CheY-like chemotaxis protein